MSAPDLSRPLLRWLYVNQVPDTLILVCPYTPIGRVPKGAVVVELTDCAGPQDTGLCAQLLASGVRRVHIAECCTTPEGEGPGSLYELFPDVTAWQEPTSRWGTRSPDILYLGHIALPRRMVLGLAGKVAGPLNLAASEQLRELQALEQLRETARIREQAPAAGARSAARNLSADGCVACGVCVAACPESALKLPVRDDAATLTFDSSLCQGGLQCVQLCPVGALTDGGVIPLTELAGAGVRILSEVPVATCQKCWVRHPDVGQPYCQSCRIRQESGFGATANVEELIERARKHREALFG